MAFLSFVVLEVVGVGQDCSGEAFVDFTVSRYRKQRAADTNFGMVPAFGHLERETFHGRDRLELA